jgi:hypothetical protein
MPLVDVNLPIGMTAVPSEVCRFLREAERRIERFQLTGRVPGFVPCDFERAYAVLRDLAAADLAPGNLFCEWGSGFGVVACLAAMLDFDASGIEIERELVEATRRLADDFGLPAEFICGSFVPPGGEAHVLAGGRYAWLTTEADQAYAELGLRPDDLDVIFAYPWPDEERVIRDLFERYAAVGAVLVTYHGGADFQLRWKTEHRQARA